MRVHTREEISIGNLAADILGDDHISVRELYEALGGRPALERVHRLFYDRLYAPPWLSGFFKDIPREVIEAQQTDFMAAVFGGPDRYCGRFPVDAHRHLFITEEQFDIRHGLLRDALIEAQVPAPLRERWLRVDGAFRTRLVKRSVSECVGRFATEAVVVVPRPAG